MTTQDTPHSQIKSLEGSVTLDSFTGILRTGGREATGCRGERTDAALVEEDGQQQQPLQRQAEIMPDAFHKCLAMRWTRLDTRLSTTAEG